MPKPELDIDADDEQKRWQGAFKRPQPAPVQAPQQPPAQQTLQTQQPASAPPAPGQATSNTPAQGAAAIMAARQQPAPAPAAPAAPAKALTGGAQSTGRFANFAQYFNANAQSSANIANKMAAEAQARAQAAQDALRNQKADFYSGVAQDTAAGRITEREGFDNEALAQQIRDAQGNVIGISNDDSREALLRQQYGSANALDSALIGGQGAGRFDALKKQFGGLGEEYDKETAAASEFAGAQQKARKATLADEQRLYEERAALEARDAAQQADANQRAEQDLAVRRSKGTYDDYMALSPLEAARRAGRQTDAVGGLWAAVSGHERTGLDWATDQLDKWFDQEGATAQERVKYYFSMAEGPEAGLNLGQDGMARVFNSMTPDELAALQKWKGHDIINFIKKRSEELKGKK